jgi:pyruvate dehydrogenase E2 component (dihydrolipoamide acetyltransferase)
MPTKVFMEALSPTMEEGRLVKWLKNEGDTVANGDVLAEVETDKAIMELVARGAGVLRKRLVKENDTAPVGTLIGVIAGADENIDELVSGAGAAAGDLQRAQAAGTASGGAPPAGVGAPAPEAAGTAPATPPAGRAQSEPPARGKASPAPDAVPAAGTTTPGTRGAPPPTGDARAPGADGRTKSSPLARRLAAERGLDLDALQGSGPGGRIIKRDIEAAPAFASKPAPVAAPQPAIAEGDDFRDVPLTQIRKTIARRLAESIGPVPTFYLTADYDMERVAEMRAAMVELGEEYKVSFNDIVLKSVATALARHPECNAHWLGDHIRYFNRVHVGMAVAVEDGLITPVIFDADRKGLSDIAREARDLAARARERRLRPDEYMGATFSVSNLGMFGIEHFTAIINPPEAGILAVGGIEPRPVAHGGSLVARRRMKVTMSCDHRVIDGATGARFLQTLRRLLENPLLLVY